MFNNISDIMVSGKIKTQPSSHCKAQKKRRALCVLRSILIPLKGCVAHFIILFRVCRLYDLPHACRNPVR